MPRTDMNVARRGLLLRRVAMALVGIVLLYAPIALLTRGLVWLTDSPLVADAHRICLRMPIQWLAQPWMYGTMWEQPLYLVVVVLLPALALLLGPLFCGWLCPPAMLTELLSRLLPARWQLDPPRWMNPVPVRFGVLAGVILAPFFGGSVCCAFCNFSHMQGLVSALFGEPTALLHWAAFTMISFALWLVVLGLFTRGGRGWCLYLCPAGALQGLSHWIGVKLGWGRGLHIDAELCRGCGSCAEVCPARAVSLVDTAESERRAPRISRHLCNICLECRVGCPRGAISYRRLSRRRFLALRVP